MTHPSPADVRSADVDRPGSAAAPPPGAVRPVSPRPVIPRNPGAHVRRGAGVDEVRLTEGFWAQRQAVNATATLAHCVTWIERLGWLANFDRVAAGRTDEPDTTRTGWSFSDSEVYKLLEALAWEFGRTGDPEADRLLVELTGRVAAAQDPDGYLNTGFGHPGQPDRYSDLQEGHELYCVGHLLQAAVARLRTVGPDRLVAVARRAADEVCRTFGPDGRVAICGHPEIEVGLVELGRALDEPRYVQQAALFVERRGHGLLGPIPLLGPAYFQDDVPVRESDVWRGHAVRQLYLAAAAIDVAAENDDAELLGAVRRQWDRSVARRTYLTGGMGSRHQDEGFGEDWELPPDRAYCETCAAVASVMVSWRLYLATGEVRYVDLMERTFYNVVATSPRGDGRAFFYANPLHQRSPGTDVRAGEENPRAEGGVRAPWFDVSCCPNNVARTLASWHTYAAAVDVGADAVTLLQYASGRYALHLADGAPVALTVTTGYPVDGEVRVRAEQLPGRPVTLRLRVPGWATGAELVAGDGPRPVAPGWVETVLHAPGEEIVLRLPVAPRWTWPDARIDAVRGCVAVERGPVVLCLEELDLPTGVVLDDVTVDPDADLLDDGDGAIVRVRASRSDDADFPYLARPGAEARGVRAEPATVRLGPYHRWAERGPTAMRVFVPTATDGSE